MGEAIFDCPVRRAGTWVTLAVLLALVASLLVYRSDPLDLRLGRVLAQMAAHGEVSSDGLALLGRHTDRVVQDWILRRDDRGPRQRLALHRSLDFLSPLNAVAALTAMLDEPVAVGVRRRILDLLERIGHADAVPPLLDRAMRLEEDGLDGEEFLASARRIAPAVFAQSLVRRLTEGRSRSYARQQAAALLGRHGCREGLAALLAVAADGAEAMSLRRTCVNAVARVGDREGLVGLRPLLRDEDPLLRRLAGEAMIRLSGGERRIRMEVLTQTVWQELLRRKGQVSVDELEAIILREAERQGLDPNLVRAVIRTESSFRPDVVSSSGAQGLMQLMPETARELGVGDAFDPRENVRGGALYLRRMLDRFGNDLDLALAAYNAGPGRVARAGGVPPIAETRRYVKKVRAFYAGYGGRAP